MSIFTLDPQTLFHYPAKTYRASSAVKRTLFIRRCEMAGSTYKIIELVGTSDKSWEEAATVAVETAGESLKDLRIAEITKLDVTIENGKVKSYRTRVNVSFKYHGE
jgi:flavin-binding protein dodecin